MLEKLIANRILWQLGNSDALSPRQYGFMPQRGTEDALYDAVKLIEAAVYNKKIAIAVSLDIEGAFDNAWWPAILHQLILKGVEPALLKIMSSYLSVRTVIVKYSGEEVKRETNKGCIQGSTCGPLLWNILLDSLLEETKNLCVHVQAFADDILLIGTGKEGRKLEQDLNNILEVIASWGERHKLRFAPHKTQCR